ncbi:hypothetical protein KKH05_02170 [Patescibacteria group bacterium]|nr:hypothetical protein [Patescibacteria group bacterium]
MDGIVPSKRWEDLGPRLGRELLPGHSVGDRVIRAVNFIGLVDGHEVVFEDGSSIIVPPGLTLPVREQVFRRGDW